MGKFKGFVLGLVSVLTLSSSAFAVEFETIRGNMKGMTSVAWKSYKGSLEGQTVNWSGWVSDVKEGSGGYRLLIDMDPPGSASIQDIYIDAVPEQIAGHFQKNERVSFSGRIKSVNGLFGACQIDIEQAKFSQ
jgi:hypothetical protein